ncbi:MAG: aldehyde ferredoxin oxidoreductase family protein [Candidatus Hermodarchaeota archaeon]
MTFQGFWNKLLFINLTEQSTEIIEPGIDFYQQFLGGYGLGVRFLFEHLQPKLDPLDAENLVGFFPGLLTGTGFPMTGRWMVVTKSPLTNLWNDSNCGGRCGPAMKRTGFDGIIFKGRAKNPMYVTIFNEEVRLHDASAIWGKTTHETHKFLKQKYPKAKPLCIGPAGEKLVRFAAVIDDQHRAAARGGTGAVMGSKNLKAVVFEGKKKVPLTNLATFKELSREYRNFLKIKPSWIARQPSKLMKMSLPLLRKVKFQVRASAGTPNLTLATLKQYGSCVSTSLLTQMGDAPVKNWSGIGFIDFPTNKSGKLSDDNIIKYNTKNYGCSHCYISCGAKASVKEGKWKDLESYKPEYETLAAFGSLCLIDETEFIFKVNSLCDQLGLDTISTGAVVAFAIECAERGLLQKENLKLEWGNSDAVYELVELIGSRSDIGDLLAEGVMRTCEKIGSSALPYAIHVHGQELAMHDPKHDPIYGIAYIAEAIPGRHNQAVEVATTLADVQTYLKTIGENIPKRYDYNGKGRYQALVSPYLHVADSLGFCHYALVVGNMPSFFDVINAVTGWNNSLETLFLTGERIKTLKHLFNIREGASPKDFALPDRVKGEPPQKKGPLANVTLDVEQMKTSYYETLDWDKTTGIPSEKKLEKLNLKELWKQQQN